MADNSGRETSSPRPLRESQLAAMIATRLSLADLVVGVCFDCDEPILGIEAACPSLIKNPDGTCERVWLHARCVGCDVPDSVRHSPEGCGLCARECELAPEPFSLESARSSVT